MKSAHDDRQPTAWEVTLDDVAHAQPATHRSHFSSPDDERSSPWSYWAKRGRAVLRLSLIEFRILKFLATHPNRAFTPESIASAVSTRRQHVTPKTLGRHIHSLRGQLGFYNDYIQSVPFIGYRFKS